MIFVVIMLTSTMNAVFRRILRSGHLTFQNRADLLAEILALRQ